MLIAAGVGITPLLSMLRTLADRGDRRRHLLIVAARTEDELMLRPEIASLHTRLSLRVVDVLSRPHPAWLGETGRITRSLLARRLPRRPQRLEYFVCGPQPMVSAASRDLSGLGVPLRRIHTERFGAA